MTCTEKKVERTGAKLGWEAVGVNANMHTKSNMVIYNAPTSCV